MALSSARHRDNSTDFWYWFNQYENIRHHFTGDVNHGADNDYENAYCTCFGSTTRIPDLEIFDDWVHVKDPHTGRYPVGPCYHLKIRLPVLPQAVSYHTFLAFGIPGTRRWIPNANGHTPYMPIGRTAFRYATRALYDARWANDSSLPDSVVRDLALEAFNYFSTVFPTELPVGEFLQNFTQLRALLPEIKDSILQTLSGGYLTKEFGWDNLLSDLSSLNGLFDSIQDRMKSLKRTYGIPQRMGFHRGNIYQLPDAIDSYHFFEDAFYGAVGSEFRLSNFNYEFRATAWITQTLDFIDDAIGWIRALGMSFGLDNPVLLFWQLVPFSFVVDWFLNVSGHLQRWLTARPAVGWNIDSFTYSITRSEDWSVRVLTDAGTSYESEAQSITMTLREYSRDTGLPVDEGLLDLHSLSKNQLILLAALGLG